MEFNNCPKKQSISWKVAIFFSHIHVCERLRHKKEQNRLCLYCTWKHCKKRMVFFCLFNNVLKVAHAVPVLKFIWREWQQEWLMSIWWKKPFEKQGVWQCSQLPHIMKCKGCSCLLCKTITAFVFPIQKLQHFIVLQSSWQSSLKSLSEQKGPGGLPFYGNKASL